MIVIEDCPVKNQCLKALYEYCTLMMTEEEKNSFSRGYNYAFKLMKVRIVNMDRYDLKLLKELLSEK